MTDASAPATVLRRQVVVRDWRSMDYGAALEAMRAFTQARGPDTADEIWLVEHPPVFTMGLAARAEHVLAPGAIPVSRPNGAARSPITGPDRSWPT